ncbi:hypothetical protein ACWKT5_24275 [Streptomyces avermitilis]
MHGLPAAFLTTSTSEPCSARASCHASPGQGLVLVPQKQDYQRHPMAQWVQNAVVAKRGSLTGWYGGPVLAPWPTREIIGDLADNLHGRATHICVLPWGDDPFADAW